MRGLTTTPHQWRGDWTDWLAFIAMAIVLGVAAYGLYLWWRENTDLTR